MAEVATRAGAPVETLRKIESGRVPTPAFFTVAALATASDLPLNDARCVYDHPGAPPTRLLAY